jgi:hypothetical protein
MKNGFRSRPRGVGEQFETELQKTREALGNEHLQSYALNSSNACSMTRKTSEGSAGGNGGRPAGIPGTTVPLAGVPRRPM